MNNQDQRVLKQNNAICTSTFCVPLLRLLRYERQIRLHLSAAGPTNRPQSKVTKTMIIEKLKLWPASGCETKAVAEIGSHP